MLEIFNIFISLIWKYEKLLPSIPVPVNELILVQSLYTDVGGVAGHQVQLEGILGQFMKLITDN